LVLIAAALKLYYSAASVDDLRWILAPTTFLVELLSGKSFDFESHAGYMSSDHSFLIAASCSGMNFLFISFLMLGLGKLWRNRLEPARWQSLPAALLIAYFTTVAANTVRIYIALWLHATKPQIFGMSSGELHRIEGILVYFGFLLMLFAASDNSISDERNIRESVRRFSLPLMIYYAATLGIPVLNGSYREPRFWEHASFVIFTPFLLITTVAAFGIIKDQLLRRRRSMSHPESLGST
jgi:exosortase K